jgi:hypothetical protein
MVGFQSDGSGQGISKPKVKIPLNQHETNEALQHLVAVRLNFETNSIGSHILISDWT